jgi:hypothetical protein
MSDIPDLIAKMKKEEQEFYANMEKEENDAIIQLGKCFALRFKLRSEEGLDNLFNVANRIMYAMQQVKDNMIDKPGMPEYPVTFASCSNDRIFQIVSAIFETRGNCFNMNVKIP